MNYDVVMIAITESKKVRITYCLLVFFNTIILLSACGGGGSDTIADSSGIVADNTTNDAIEQDQSVNESPAVFIPPTDAASLQSALHTRYVSASDFDVWLCSISDSTTPFVAYAFPVAGTLGDGLVGNEYVISTGGESSFVWQTLNGTAIRTTSLDTGTVVETSDYQFSGENRISFKFDSTNFNCDRVDNTIAFGGAPTTVSPDNGVTLSLESENARIPDSNRPISATAASTFDPIFFSNEADMVMRFPNGLQTACVDWDLVRGQPLECGRNWEIVDVGDLTPFQAGQTVDNTFGLLSSTSGGIPNQLILNSAGEISIGAGAGEIFGIENRPDGLVTGRYYLNGFTVTLELNGQIFHTFAAISGEENGRVTHLFLAGRFYSENL